MTSTINTDEWDQDLRNMLGHAPPPNFDAWQTKYAIETVEAPHVDLNKRSGYGPDWALTLAKLAASILLAASGTWLVISMTATSRALFATEIPGVDRVQRMTWTETFFIRVTSADQKRHWIEKERVDVAYQQPGRYRKTHFDRNDQISFIEVIDMQARRALTLNPNKKEAELKYPSERVDERGPFAWVGDYVRGQQPGAISLQGKHVFDSIETNVVQWKGKHAEGKQTARFYFAVDSKQLVGMTTANPGIEFDPENPTGEWNQPAEEKWYRQEPIACRTHQVNLSASPDAKMFSLDAPEGYKVEQIAKPTVTESELITFLGAAAQFNEGVFPDSAIEAFDTQKFNAASRQEPSNRSAAAKALIEIRDQIMMREIYRSPVLQFIEDHVQGDSFQYVGSEVKSGDASRLVAWYRPKGGAKYRAIYGDMSVKEVSETELTLRNETNVP